jgi:hypothetical protein
MPRTTKRSTDSVATRGQGCAARDRTGRRAPSEEAAAAQLPSPAYVPVPPMRTWRDGDGETIVLSFLGPVADRS